MTDPQTPDAPADPPEWATDPVPATDDDAVRGPVADPDAAEPAPLANEAYMTPAVNADTGEEVPAPPPSDALEDHSPSASDKA